MIAYVETKTFSSFKSLLMESVVPYQEIIENEAVIKYVISSAQTKLSSIRTKNTDAAGLIVASSVEHARQISTLMKTCFNEDTVIVTYRESEPTSIIQQFRHAQTKWIISVGMISEGTNIPRLQICCHLTNIKTEMHFRQILGRILRMTSSKNQEAIMYMPAEPKLLEYAYRVKQDVPFEADVVKFEKMKAVVQEDIEGENLSSMTFDKKKASISKVEVDLNGFDDVVKQPVFYGANEVVEKHFLTNAYERVVNISGRFQQESIALGLSELR
jgi:superfamily II DNA or RNA helicase